jgi:hypothetical protein
MPNLNKVGIKPVVERFSDFNVHSLDDNSAFFHIDIADTISFYQVLFDYFFDDNKLLRIAENKSNLNFYPNQKHYITLYQHLLKYLDDFNEKKTFNEISEDLLKVLSDEYVVENTADGKYAVRLDKLGKIGEHIFSVLLSEYFRFDCIIPKVNLTTNPNMNVYGIDVLFYSSRDSMLLFGESKFSKSLNNGISLIQKSLQEYEQQLRNEYVLILSSRILKAQLNFFTEIYGDITERSIDIEKFISNAKITKIGIPIFIAHGTEKEAIEILGELSKIKRYQFFGLTTVYYAISLPVLNKDKAVATLTNRIKEKLEGYKHGSETT